MTGDSSGGAMGSLLSILVAPYSFVTQWQQLFGGHPRGSGASATRAANQIAYAMLRMQRQQARLARQQWELDQQLMFPSSPVYAPLVPTTQTVLPVKLTTKQTKIEQLLMQKPDSPKLLKKQAHIAAKITKYIGKHPESQVPVTTTRKF